MTELIKILGVAVVTVLAYILVKQTKPELAMFITIAGSIAIIIMTIDSLKFVITDFYKIFSATGVDTSMLTQLMKIIGIGYIAEFGANICLDAGVGSVADKILFSAKIIIFVIALPIINTVVDMVVELI